jgi:hypothetical protein
LNARESSQWSCLIKRLSHPECAVVAKIATWVEMTT